jgi:hypothetical protein
VADLYITPTRRLLLEDIAAGEVYRSGPHFYVPAPATRAGRLKVCAGVRELAAAGLVAVLVAGAKPELTDAGREALNGGGPS